MIMISLVMINLGSEAVYRIWKLTLVTLLTKIKLHFLACLLALYLSILDWHNTIENLLEVKITSSGALLW